MPFAPPAPLGKSFFFPVAPAAKLGRLRPPLVALFPGVQRCTSNDMEESFGAIQNLQLRMMTVTQKEQRGVLRQFNSTSCMLTSWGWSNRTSVPGLGCCLALGYSLRKRAGVMDIESKMKRVKVCTCNSFGQAWLPGCTMPFPSQLAVATTTGNVEPCHLSRPALVPHVYTVP